jgi:chloride channel protein, CIC family
MPLGPEPPRSRRASWLGNRRLRSVIGDLLPEDPPLDLQLVGRTLLHAAVVGVAAGLIGAAFFAVLEGVQYLLLERATGYQPLRATGEELIAHHDGGFQPLLLILVTTVGALLGGLASSLAPETRGGGGDAMIHAFHLQGGRIRRRVLAIKPLASILALGSGGAGGREGPTMHIGGALGSLASDLLSVGPRERRVLMVAGVAAGISAVFRTPLGAALLAIEVLYRDDFEAEALIPAVLASVVSYSVAISIFGESTLFGRLPEYGFVPTHLPLYALLALIIALAGRIFLMTLGAVRRLSARLPGPSWARPAWGGLALGLVAVPAILYVDYLGETSGQGLGILGGGYGAAQMAITGGSLLPGISWRTVELLGMLVVLKLVASSLTIGTGGSAGDFAPSIALGGLIGGAFGVAARLVLDDPRIEPGAFALVGMGTFYGGIAHVPLAALVLVSEMAGSYDLLVPMMLAEAIALLALRRHSLYPAQPLSTRDSPVHRPAFGGDLLMTLKVGEVLDRARPMVRFAPDTPMAMVLARAEEAPSQEVFPVLEGDALRGMITGAALRLLASNPGTEAWSIAADAMEPAVTIGEDVDLRAATEALVASGQRELIVLGKGGEILGLVDEHDLSRAYLEATRLAGPPPG